MAALWNAVINSCSESVRVSAEIKENFRQSLISQPFCPPPHPIRLWFTPAIRTGEKHTRTLVPISQSTLCAFLRAPNNCFIGTRKIGIKCGTEPDFANRVGLAARGMTNCGSQFPCLISPQIIRITFNSQANFTVSGLSQPVPRFFDGPPSVARPGAIFVATVANETSKTGFGNTTLSCFG